jgi:glutathione peroxidase
MKTVIIVIVLAVLIAAAASMYFLRGVLSTGSQKPTGDTGNVFWDLKTNTLAGDPVDLADWRGQVALVVNVASKCGLTPQYEGLQSLYGELKDDGFVILAFPSNDFMGQESGTPAEIREFCTANYGVTFPIFGKVKVKGRDKDEIYAWLTSTGLEEPTWNFTKYLIGRDGRIIARFAPRTKPDDGEMMAAIRKALG